jgi:hemerythrin-like domain-containing protein
MNATVTLHRTPSAGFDKPFEMLAACHERVERTLALLLRLAAHLPTHGADEQARAAAHDVMRYFDIAGPAHHEDEERHVFPALLKQPGAPLKPLVRQLKSEHLAMKQQWALVRADLEAVEAGHGALGAEVLQRWQAFAALYREHMAAEDGQAYLAARSVMLDDGLVTMGREMASRRGVQALPAEFLSLLVQRKEPKKAP